MKKLLLFVLVAVGVGLVGCSDESENEGTDKVVEEESGKEVSEGNARAVRDIEDDEVIGQVGDVEMTGEDLRYEMKRLELIYALSGDSTEASPTVAIQEFTRNVIIHQLAEEQDIAVNESEQEKRAKAVRDDLSSNESYEDVMKDVDEEVFWERETERYEIILEAEELITLLMEEEKKDHPDYTEQALRFDAQEALDEWIQEKLSGVDVHFDEIEG